MEDPFLNYLALGILFFVVIILVYGIIAIHDIPAQIAKKRHHPHEDAIHAAGWISLAMLHILWPFLWIWAMMYRPERGWGFGQKPGEPASPAEAVAELQALKNRLAMVEAKLGIEDRSVQSGEGRIRTVSEGPQQADLQEDVATAETVPAQRGGAQR
jgi:Protein of unknown function (DUF3302)